MADIVHLAARFLHVGAAMLWVGYLGFLAWAVIPAAREEGDHGPNIGPIVARLRPFTFLGPLVLALGLWLITASGHSYGQLLEPGWGHAISGGIVLSLAMMGLEHSLVLPKLREAHRGPADERRENLDRAALGAGGCSRCSVGSSSAADLPRFAGSTAMKRSSCFPGGKELHSGGCRPGRR